MRRSGASCAFRYALDLTDEEEAGQRGTSASFSAASVGPKSAYLEGPMVRTLSAGGDWTRTFSSARRWALVSGSPTSPVYLGRWPRRRCRITMIEFV
jgi:hypothetical protein